MLIMGRNKLIFHQIRKFVLDFSQAADVNESKSGQIKLQRLFFRKPGFFEVPKAVSVVLSTAITFLCKLKCNFLLLLSASIFYGGQGKNLIWVIQHFSGRIFLVSNQISNVMVFPGKNPHDCCNILQN